MPRRSPISLMQNYHTQKVEMEIRNIVMTTILGASMPLTASAQFYSVTQGNEMCLQREDGSVLNAVNKADSLTKSNKTLKDDTLVIKSEKKAEKAPQVQKSNRKVCPKKVEKPRHEDVVTVASNMMVVSDRKGDISKQCTELPDLTIPNLYNEIKRNGIRYPDIVLAQAILETGRFRSSACRKKNNLFGLANPRTGKYYEFDHWTDSVRVYYTKVQYRYKNGNYLLWLKKIGYAEDKNYIRAVIKVLKMLS